MIKVKVASSDLLIFKDVCEAAQREAFNSRNTN
jgi:hypothetical protein